MSARASSTLLLLASVLAACSGGAGSEVFPSTIGESIFHGTREPGEPWAVAVHYLRPGTTRIRLCSGSVIGAKVVLTAKHCVFDEVANDVWQRLDPSVFTVAVTDDVTPSGSVVSERGVIEVRTTPGDYTRANALGGDDIAVLLLDGDIGVPPKPISRTPPVLGDAVRILGFGFTETDALGLKYSATVTVSNLGTGVFETGGSAWTCSGDSGGPALHTARGELVGVTSYGPASCAVPDSFYTRVDRHTALIDAALGTAPCTPSAEVCDGRDNDCDGVVDPGCAPPTACGPMNPCGAGLTCDDGVCKSSSSPVPRAATSSDDGGCTLVPRSVPGSCGALVFLAGTLLVGIARRRRLAMAARRA